MVLGHRFRALLQDVYVSRKNAFAKGTYSNLRTQVRSYFAFCVYFERDPLPADVDTIHGYVQFLSRSLKPPTIRNYLSGVKMLHIFHGLPDVFSDDFMLDLELKGILRMHPHVPHRARPVTPNILLVFHRVMDQDESLHCSGWACSLFLFYTLYRFGSMLPSFGSTPRHHFFTEGLLVTFLHTKMIQFSKRWLTIPLLRSDSVLCRLKAHLWASSRSSGDHSSPAFTFITKDKVSWLTFSSRTFMLFFCMLV